MIADTGMRRVYSLVIVVAALALAGGCSSSSSSGGGGGLSAEESAAVAAFAGADAARGAAETLPDDEAFAPDDGATGGGTGMSVMDHDGSGCIHDPEPTPTTGTQAVFGGDVDTTQVTYDNYSWVCPDASASVDGTLRYGDDGSRFFAEFGKPGAGDGFFEATVQSGLAPDMYFNMAALIMVCDNCGGGTDDGGYTGYTAPEFQANMYMNAQISVDQLEGAFRFGESPGEPLALRWWNQGGPDEASALDGRIGVEQSGSPCGFDWKLDTVVPVTYQADEPWDGQVTVSDPQDPSTSYDVVIDQGAISVNGQLITEERKQQIAETCGFE